MRFRNISHSVTLDKKFFQLTLSFFVCLVLSIGFRQSSVKYALRLPYLFLALQIFFVYTLFVLLCRFFLPTYTKKKLHKKEKISKCNPCWFLYDISKVPTYFWASKTFSKLLNIMKKRIELCRKITDMTHYIYCGKKKFHIDLDDECTCVHCEEILVHYHSY